jgi:single-stranded-DNA-specific exonuclease
VERLSQELRVVPALAQLLVNRGVLDAAEAIRFLRSPLSGLHDPSLLPGVDQAAERIYSAIREEKKVCIYGDYDVDGITGTTILWRCLQLAGAKETHFYVPHRLEEGYGLNSEALRSLKREGYDVVVTVDCGITSVKEAEVARELGVELIVTDHHEFKPELPDALLVHPRLEGSGYPFGELCGAGVAFKLAWAICRQFSQARKVTPLFQNFLLECMALVSLGTVADMVPLAGENRVFVKHGLRSLRSGPSIGLRALLAAANLIDKPELDAGHIGFQLAPRINAAGRLGQGRLAVELLATASEQRAQDLARYLNEQNELRQKIERGIFYHAREQIDSSSLLSDAPALVLDDPDWHAGVIGIVAGRLVERYARPVLLISGRDTPCQGSARSVAGFHLHQALSACSEFLLGHGGHAAAAGFKIAPENIEPFRRRFCEVAGERLNGRPREHRLIIDAEVPLSAVTFGLLRGIEALEPHGLGNRRPLFLAGGLQVIGEPKKVGGGERHVSFRVRQETGPQFKAIGFGMADRLDELMSVGGQCCLVFTPKRNQWQDWVSIDLEVIDFQPGPRAVLSTVS